MVGVQIGQWCRELKYVIEFQEGLTFLPNSRKVILRPNMGRSLDFVGCSLSFLVVYMARKEKVSGILVGGSEVRLVEKWDFFL
ncbi:hypothetical protein KY289_001240 [Solanum tuberosum]|nr:hypothetical protein KY289_001240 [Solanum tuberosum]